MTRKGTKLFPFLLQFFFLPKVIITPHLYLPSLSIFPQKCRGRDPCFGRKEGEGKAGWDRQQRRDDNREFFSFLISVFPSTFVRSDLFHLFFSFYFFRLTPPVPKYQSQTSLDQQPYFLSFFYQFSKILISSSTFISSFFFYFLFFICC